MVKIYKVKVYVDYIKKCLIDYTVLSIGFFNYLLNTCIGKLKNHKLKVLKYKDLLKRTFCIVEVKSITGYVPAVGMGRISSNYHVAK